MSFGETFRDMAQDAPGFRLNSARFSLSLALEHFPLALNTGQAELIAGIQNCMKARVEQRGTDQYRFTGPGV